MICVADRENGRVLCFDTDGNAKKEIQPEGFGGRIFGISYAKQQLYAVSGPEFNPFAPKPVGFILDVESGQIDGTFQVIFQLLTKLIIVIYSTQRVIDSFLRILKFLLLLLIMILK